MGQKHRVTEKRRRRKLYLKRKRENDKLNGSVPNFAKKVEEEAKVEAPKEDAPAAKPAKKAAKKATKKAAKKAAKKKAAPKKDAE